MAAGRQGPQSAPQECVYLCPALGAWGCGSGGAVTAVVQRAGFVINRSFNCYGAGGGRIKKKKKRQRFVGLAWRQLQREEALFLQRSLELLTGT